MFFSELWDPKRWGAPVEHMPHYGAKERKRWKRCYESRYLNEPSIDAAVKNGASPVFHERAIPTICQQSKRQYARSNGEKG